MQELMMEPALPGRKLTRMELMTLRSCIVQGMELGEINNVFRRHKMKPICRTTLYYHRNDYEVVAAIERVSISMRVRGLANRSRMVATVCARLYNLEHRINGTTPLAGCPSMVDEDVPAKDVDNETFVMLLQEERRQQEFLLMLTSEVDTETTITFGHGVSANARRTRSDQAVASHITKLVNEAWSLAIEEIAHELNEPDGIPPGACVLR